MHNNTLFIAPPYLLVNSAYLVLLPLSRSQKGPVVTVLPQVLEMWVLADTLQVSRLQLPGTHISRIILIPFFRWPGLSQALHQRSLPAFHPLLLLSVCINIICPQNCKSWVDLHPQPVWVRMISTLQRKEMTEFIPNFSASSLNACHTKFFLVKKLRLPLSRHIVMFTLTQVSEGNGQFQLFFKVSSPKEAEPLHF